MSSITFYGTFSNNPLQFPICPISRGLTLMKRCWQAGQIAASTRLRSWLSTKMVGSPNITACNQNGSVSNTELVHGGVHHIDFTLLPSASYTVKFYDGVIQNVKEIHVKPFVKEVN